jgi:RHS repeat-associated protein
MNRVVSDGTSSATWNYVRNTTALTTTITTPALADTPNAFDTVITFNTSGQEIQRRICSTSPCGSGSLRIINTNWATNGTPSGTITFLEDNNTRREVDTTYDSNGLLDSVIEYDWGTGAHGSTNPIRTTSYTHQTSTNYTNLNILDLVTSVQISSGTVLYRQDTTYDGVALSSSNCPTGALQHSDAGFPCTFNYRGNPTAVTMYLAPATQGNPITKNFTYDWFGNLITAQVNCCQTKTWSYSSATQYSLPDSVTSGTSPGQTLTTSATYNSYTGQPLTVTDENLLVTNFSYDTLRRPAQVWQTIGSTTGVSVSTSYDDVNFTTTTTATIDASKSVQQVTAFDTLGRPKLTTTEDAANNVYSKVSAVYDLAGRPYQVSNPFTGASGSYWTTTAFDLLGRPTKITLPDNSFTQYSYSLNTVTVTDPAGVQRKSQSDAAGRLTSVWEPDPANGNSLTLQTTYLYNVLDDLTQITQGAQTRSYVYDAIGRLLSATTPEAGRVCFGSLTGSTCNADGYDGFNNLLKRTDARGVLTSYAYDSLNRLTGITYNVGTSGVPATAPVSLTYGTSASQFNNGRLITMTDGVGSENYSYNNLGQLAQLQKVINGTTYTTSYAYNISGELTQITYPSGRVVQQSVDPIGRLCEVAPSTSGCGTAAAPFATGFLYNTAGQTTGFKYGNNIYASFGFSSDRLQLNCLDYSTTNRGGACTHDGTTKFGLNYSYPATPGNNGLISGISDSVDSGRSASYTFDSLYRLATAQTAGSTNYPAWGLSETYDRYGNRTQQAALPNTCVTIACPQPSFAVSASTNRLVGSPYSYDASGNMTNDGINTLVYDAENHLVSATNGGASGTYTYDGNGLRVKKVSGSNNTVYIFSGSKVIAEYDNGAAVGSPSREYIYSGSALLAKIDSSGTKYYHQDHLSNRMVTDASGTKVAEMGTFPYGESWYNASSDKLVFTTYERDSESGNDYAHARYNVSGLARFSSPDPIAGSTSDPQSFNRYSYVRNMPVMLSDPSGLIPSCTTLDNRSPEFFSSGPTWGGGPSDASLSSEAEALPPSGCGGPPPCQYTFAGCGGGFGGDDGGDGGAGLGGLFPGDGGGGFGGAGSGLGDFGPFGFFGGGDLSGGGGWGPGFGADLLYGALPDCFPFFSDGAGFSVMAGNCGSQSGSSGGGNSSSQQQIIENARRALLGALLNDPKCISFLGRYGADALRTLKNISITPGFVSPNMHVQAETRNADTFPNALVPPNASIVVNTQGFFFTNTKDVPFQGGVLLHELGHATGVLPSDTVDDNGPATMARQEANKQALQLNCSKTLNSVGKN